MFSAFEMHLDYVFKGKGNKVNDKQYEHHENKVININSHQIIDKYEDTLTSFQISTMDEDIKVATHLVDGSILKVANPIDVKISESTTPFSNCEENISYPLISSYSDGDEVTMLHHGVLSNDAIDNNNIQLKSFNRNIAIDLKLEQNNFLKSDSDDNHACPSISNRDGERNDNNICISSMNNEVNRIMNINASDIRGYLQFRLIQDAMSEFAQLNMRTLFLN